MKPELESAFELWWETDGRYLDPDTSDVDWFDKRKELAALAFIAGIKVAYKVDRIGYLESAVTVGRIPVKICGGCGSVRVEAK